MLLLSNKENTASRTSKEGHHQKAHNGQGEKMTRYEHAVLHRLDAILDELKAAREGGHKRSGETSRQRQFRGMESMDGKLEIHPLRKAQKIQRTL